MGYTPRAIEFNPPRRGIDDAPSLYPTKEAQTRRNLETIESMLVSATDPESRKRLMQRRDDLKREIDKKDTKRQAQLRALWHSVIERRSMKECR